MNPQSLTFRRNLVIAGVAHLVIISGLVATERFVSNIRTSAPIGVELIVPAAFLGDLPKGPGHGTGSYAPPREPARAEANVANETAVPGDETPAPAPKPAAKPAPESHEVLVHRKPAAPERKARSATSRTAVAERSSSQSTAKETRLAKASTTRAPSADDFRRRFDKALQAAGDDGTPDGDNQRAGGGTATRGRYGHPDGTENGVPGGIGKGTPFWWYYQHVHDKMYEAWERPGEMLNSKRDLVTRVIVRVARDGRILEVRLENSSGNQLMDESALTAARKVQRLQPLPDGLGEAYKDISVDFELEG